MIRAAVVAVCLGGSSAFVAVQPARVSSVAVQAVPRDDAAKPLAALAPAAQLAGALTLATITIGAPEVAFAATSMAPTKPVAAASSKKKAAPTAAKKAAAPKRKAAPKAKAAPKKAKAAPKAKAPAPKKAVKSAAPKAKAPAKAKAAPKPKASAKPKAAPKAKAPPKAKAAPAPKPAAAKPKAKAAPAPKPAAAKPAPKAKASKAAPAPAPAKKSALAVEPAVKAAPLDRTSAKTGANIGFKLKDESAKPKARAAAAPTAAADDGTSKLVNKAGSKQMTQLAREAPGAAKPKAIKLEKAAPPAKSASPATKKPAQTTGDFSVNPTKPGKKTYSKKGAEATDLSDAALAEKLQSKF